MQSLWSRAAPTTQSSCRCFSCLKPGATGLTSRGATAASKRRLRIGNSVTALYTSIFAAAALADARAKDKRRLEWAEKIAAVKEEVNELVNEEERLVAAITSRRRRRLFDGILQTRQYSTSRSTPTTREFQQLQKNRPSYSLHSANEPDLDQNNQLLQSIVNENQDELADDTPSDDGFFLDGTDIPEWLSGDEIRQKAIRKLALKQLAIRLLLRQSIAHSYSGLQMNYNADFDVPQLNVADLLSELNTLRRRIRQLKTSKNAYIDDLAKDLRVHSVRELHRERDRLDQEAQRDTDLFLRDKMSLPELLLRYANNLMQSTDPDRSFCIKLMILTFTKTRQNDLVDLLLKTMLPHKFPLNSSLIISILTYFRKAKNLKGFDSFLEMLRGEGYPVDMGKLGYYKRKVVNGVDITVPPVTSANPVIFSTLIAAALRFDQPDRADAWLQAGRQVGFMDDFSTLYAYLKFYAIRTDWKNGVYTLKRAIAFITSTTLHSELHVERLIVLMVQLCDCCGKLDASDSIIAAAVDSGFDWKAASERQQDVNLSNDPRFQQWYTTANESAKEHQDKPTFEKCFSFANLLGEQLEDLVIAEDKNPATRWQRMVGLYSRDVLSAMLAGPPSQHKDSKHSAKPYSKIFDPEDAKFLERIHSDQVEQPAATNKQQQQQQQEIKVLKDEVAQLKDLVFQLQRATVDPLTRRDPSFQSYTRDTSLGVDSPTTMKNKKASSHDRDEETSKRLSIRYLKSELKNPRNPQGLRLFSNADGEAAAAAQ